MLVGASLVGTSQRSRWSIGFFLLVLSDFGFELVVRVDWTCAMDDAGYV